MARYKKRYLKLMKLPIMCQIGC